MSAAAMDEDNAGGVGAEDYVSINNPLGIL